MSSNEKDYHNKHHTHPGDNLKQSLSSQVSPLELSYPYKALSLELSHLLQQRQYGYTYTEDFLQH